MKKNNTQKVLIVLIVALLFININFISAHGEEDFATAENIINQKIPCENLTEGQLEILGDYYMEQMHPGDLHEIMDERMGGEGSESLRQVHINMGLAFYCGERGAMSVGMMNLMTGRGMMDYGYTYNNKTNYFAWIFNLLFIVAIVILIVWFAKELAKSKKHKRR